MSHSPTDVLTTPRLDDLELIHIANPYQLFAERSAKRLGLRRGANPRLISKKLALDIGKRNRHKNVVKWLDISVGPRASSTANR